MKFKTPSQLKDILKNKYNSVNFNKSIVKLILNDEKLRIWLYITNNDFWFVFNQQDKGKIFRIGKKKINYRIEEYSDESNIGKLFVDDVSFIILFDKSLIGSTDIFTNLIESHKNK